MARVDSLISAAVSATYTGAGTNYLIEKPDGTLYAVYIDTLNDPAFRKSVDGGLTWSPPTTIAAVSCVNLSVYPGWYSNAANEKIYVAYTDSVSDDTFCRSIDTASSDAVSAAGTVFAGNTTASGGSLSITLNRGSTLFCRTVIDAGAEADCAKSTDDGANWSSIQDNETYATLDQAIFLPGWNADASDMQLMFWDVSANEISVQRYDNSLNSWAESSISASMVESPASLGWPHFAAAVDLDNSRNIVIAWNGIDTANADLKGWFVDDTTETPFSGTIVSDGTDDQGLCAITIDANGDLVATYAGKSDGSETWSTSLNLYRKISTDDGATWGDETLLTNNIRDIKGLFAPMKSYTKVGMNVPVMYYSVNASADGLLLNSSLNAHISPRATNLIIG